MSTAARWREVCDRLQAWRDEHGNVINSPDLVTLYEMAITDGVGALRKFHQIDEERRADIVVDKFVLTTDQIIDAENPRAFFITCLVNAAKDLLRRKDTRVAETIEEHGGFVPGHALPTEMTAESHVMIMDRRAVLALFDRVSPRDAKVMVADAMGVPREAIAEELGCSRGNVDQIISRGRSTLRLYELLLGRVSLRDAEVLAQHDMKVSRERIAMGLGIRREEVDEIISRWRGELQAARDEAERERRNGGAR